MGYVHSLLLVSIKRMSRSTICSDPSSVYNSGMNMCLFFLHVANDAVFRVLNERHDVFDF